MKEEYQKIELVKNEDRHRFEMADGEAKAFIEYIQNENKITLLHTKVEPIMAKKGGATAIIEKTLEYLEKNNFKLIPLCPLIVAYIKHHSEWKRLLAEGVKSV